MAHEFCSDQPLRRRDEFLGWNLFQLSKTFRIWRGAVFSLTLCLTILSLNCALYPAERRFLELKEEKGYPDYLATGNLVFPPSVIFSSDKFRIVNVLTDKEVPSLVIKEVRWPDKSLMLVEVGFPVRKGEGKYCLEWGEEITRTILVSEKKLPYQPFRLKGEAFLTPPMEEIPVGTLLVRVERQAGLLYYWYLIPLAGLSFILIWRKIKCR